MRSPQGMKEAAAGPCLPALCCQLPDCWLLDTPVAFERRHADSHPSRRRRHRLLSPFFVARTSCAPTRRGTASPASLNCWPDESASFDLRRTLPVVGVRGSRNAARSLPFAGRRAQDPTTPAAAAARGHPASLTNRSSRKTPSRRAVAAPGPSGSAPLRRWSAPPPTWVADEELHALGWHRARGHGKRSIVRGCRQGSWRKGILLRGRGTDRAAAVPRVDGAPGRSTGGRRPSPPHQRRQALPSRRRCKVRPRSPSAAGRRAQR